LVQQVAYESLLATDRRSLHRHVGETLERIHGEGRLDLAEILASHFEHAGDTAKALDYTTLAAEQAMRRFATAEAAGLFGKAIDLAGQVEFDEARLLRLVEQRARALELRGEYTTALSLYVQLEDIGRERAAPKLQLAGVIGAASLQAVPTPLFDPEKALVNVERALDLAKKIGDPAGQAKAYWLQMLVLTRIDAKAAVVAGNASLDLARRYALREQEAFTLNDVSSNFQTLGQPERALQALKEARPIWRSLDNLPMLADSLARTAMLHGMLAQYDQAIDRAHESLAISDRTGNLWGQSYGRIAIGLAYFARGELGPAIRELTRCVDLAEQAGFLYPQVAMRLILAIAYGEAGDLETAARLARLGRDAEKASPLPGQVSGEATLAWVAVRRGDLAEAERLLHGKEEMIAALAGAMLDNPLSLAAATTAYDLARKDFSHCLQVTEEFAAAFERSAWRVSRGALLLARGRAFVGLGRTAEAGETFATARSEMVAQGIDAGLWEVEAELAGLSEFTGDTAQSADLFRSAARRIDQIAAGLEELGLAQTFLAQAHVRAIQDSGARPSG
jgi:tetratricopeptide (TPR) repeat protein